MSATADSTIARQSGVLTQPLRPHAGENPGQRRRRSPNRLQPLIARWMPVLGVAAGAGLTAFGGSFLLPRTYISSAVFVPEQARNAQLPAGLGAIAGEIGVLSGAGGTDSPEFYQRLLTGRAIRTAVLSKPIAGVNLFGYFSATGRGDSVEKAIKKLAKVTSVSIDKAAGTVRIDVEFQQPALSAAVLQRYLDLVNDFNSTIRRTQASKRRQFVEAQTNVALADLQRAESNLKDFLTRNRIFSAPELQFERGQLDRRITAAQDLYQILSRQLQTARIDEVNDTPLISVVDPPFTPVRATGPHRLVITLMATFFGALISILYVLFWAQSERQPGDVD